MPDDGAASAPAATPLRVLVVDDEPLARDCVRLVLAAAPGVEIAGECRDGAEAVEAIRRLRPDVVFLDVQMPGLDGMAVVERVGVDAMPAVVFVTAYDSHALRAFELHALDYVLKPFENARLLAALDRARSAARARREGELARRLAGLLREWTGMDGAPGWGTASGESPTADAAPPPPPFVRRFTVRDGDRIRFVAAEEVDWIESDGNYVVLHAGGRRHRVRAVLHTLAKELDPRRFFQIHRSVIVNLDRVKEMQPWFGGDYVAILHDGKQLRVSRTRAPLLLRPVR